MRLSWWKFHVNYFYFLVYIFILDYNINTCKYKFRKEVSYEKEIKKLSFIYLAQCF